MGLPGDTLYKNNSNIILECDKHVSCNNNNVIIEIKNEHKVNKI